MLSSSINRGLLAALLALFACLGLSGCVVAVPDEVEVHEHEHQRREVIIEHEDHHDHR